MQICPRYLPFSAMILPQFLNKFAQVPAKYRLINAGKVLLEHCRALLHILKLPYLPKLENFAQRSELIS